jgi:sensor histidine kinase regulating citrate/malate metabolism
MKRSSLPENKVGTGDASFLQAVMDNPFEGILAIDNAGVITFVNSFFMDVLN